MATDWVGEHSRVPLQEFDVQHRQFKYPGVFIYKMHFDCAQCSTAALKEG
jgi:hypothetical protein